MFRRREKEAIVPAPPAPTERVTSVLGPGINWKGNLSGTGGVRIEGAYEGEIALRGLLVVGATGRVTCQNLRADVVVVAGHVKGNIAAEKLTIRTGGRVMGDVLVTTFSTEEGAFLKGTIEMKDKIEFAEVAAQTPEPAQAVQAAPSPIAGGEPPAVEVASQAIEPPPTEVSLPPVDQAPPAAQEPPSEVPPQPEEQASTAGQAPPVAERKPARSRKK